MHTEVSDLCTIRSGLTQRKRVGGADDAADGDRSPFLLRIKDIDGLDISPDYSHPVSSHGKLEKYTILAGDVVFSARGTHCRAGVMPEQEKYCIAPSQFYILTPKCPGQLLPHYLALVLSSDYAESYFRKRRKGSRVQIITKNTLSELPISAPPLETQQRLIQLHRLNEHEKQLQQGIITKRKIQFEQCIKQVQSA